MPNPDIIERLEKAEGPDRELDAAIAMWAFPWLADLPRQQNGGWIHPEFGPVAPPSPYTDAVDWAVGLVRDKLPAAEFDLSFRRGHFTGLSWWGGSGWKVSSAPNAALALLIAMFKALEVVDG